MQNTLFFWLLLCTSIVFAQKKQTIYVDSLIQSYGQISDSLLVRKLNRAAFYRVIKGDENGILIARKLREIAQSNNDLTAEIDAINVIGIDFDIRGITDSSAYYFNLYLSYSEALNDSIRIGRALNNLGMFHWHQGDFNKAITLFYRYLLLSEKINSKSGIASSCSNIGLIYNELFQAPKALIYSLKAFEARKEINDSSRLGASCNNIGICYKIMGNYDSAIIYYQMGIAYAQAMNNRRQLADNYSNLGNAYILKDDIERGYELLEKSLEFDDFGDTKSRHFFVSQLVYN